MIPPNAHISPALYSGSVVHRRVQPKSHLLNYRVFNLLLDLDRLEDIGPLHINRPGLLTFYERDHGDGKGDLELWVRTRLRDAGIAPDDLSLHVLCYPRILGYAFNPITVYFATHADGETAAILYQVNNTMGERHTYVIPVSVGDTPPFRQSCDKAMYVSPFTPMQSRYSFSIVPPGDDVCISIRQDGDEGHILNASFTGNRQALTPANLWASLATHPLMTLKVIAGIHYEAFHLWRKGVPIFRFEPQSRGEISIILPPTSKKQTEPA